MKTPKLTDVEAFLAVAEHRNFAKAATQLDLSRSTLTRFVGALEDNLGTRLLNRTTRSVALTESGQYLADKLAPLLRDYAAILESVNAFRDQPVGTLRILSWPLASRYALASLLPGFSARYPDITVDISTNYGIGDIVSGHFDAGIRAGGHIDSDMVAVRLCDDFQMIAVASPKYLKSHPTPKTIDDLKDHNCIRSRTPSGGMPKWRLKKDGHIVDFEVNGTLVFTEVMLAIRAAIDGVGITMAATDWVAGHIANGRLVPLLEDCAIPAEGFFLYYPSRLHISATLQAFVGYCQEQLKVRRAGQAEK